MEFDFTLARQCLQFSARAYNEATFADARTSTEVLLQEIEEGTFLIAFRGSREPKDYIYDAKFIGKTTWDESTDKRVHRGFANGFFAVSQAVAQAVQNAQRIIVTGHSLGGAEAFLCALFLNERKLPVTDVITFGAPRPGNAAFAQAYDLYLHNATLRFEAQGDSVPWMPPWLAGYRHLGRCAYLKNDGRVDVDPPLLAHVPAFAQQIGQLRTQPTAEFLGLFNPHFIANYERLFSQLA